jgi:hypothetical protein
MVLESILSLPTKREVSLSTRMQVAAIFRSWGMDIETEKLD